MTTMRVPEMFSWIRRRFVKKKMLADDISGHFKIPIFWAVFGHFVQKTLIQKKIFDGGFGRKFLEPKNALKTLLGVFGMLFWTWRAHSRPNLRVK